MRGIGGAPWPYRTEQLFNTILSHDVPLRFWSGMGYPKLGHPIDHDLGRGPLRLCPDRSCAGRAEGSQVGESESEIKDKYFTKVGNDA